MEKLDLLLAIAEDIVRYDYEQYSPKLIEMLKVILRACDKLSS